ncbi:MAG: YfcE family phosphodiesterase [Gemmatimonadetes bacterium]|nr:YfcE family phosphodiesterase [Gemmatimonadota bacterium]
MAETPRARVGLISDTHGHLRAEIFQALAGVERLIHAGDVEDVDHLTDLAAIAPVTAVSGNVDRVDVRAIAPEEAVLDVAGVRVAVIHGHQVHPDYRLLLARFPDAKVIVHGHTHVPRCDAVGDILIVNPGAAGKAQKGHPPSVAILEVAEGVPMVRHLRLESRVS